MDDGADGDGRYSRMGQPPSPPSQPLLREKEHLLQQLVVDLQQQQELQFQQLKEQQLQLRKLKTLLQAPPDNVPPINSSTDTGAIVPADGLPGQRNAALCGAPSLTAAPGVAKAVPVQTVLPDIFSPLAGTWPTPDKSLFGGSSGIEQTAVAGAFYNTAISDGCDALEVPEKLTASSHRNDVAQPVEPANAHVESRSNGCNSPLLLNAGERQRPLAFPDILSPGAASRSGAASTFGKTAARWGRIRLHETGAPLPPQIARPPGTAEVPESKVRKLPTHSMTVPISPRAAPDGHLLPLAPAAEALLSSPFSRAGFLPLPQPPRQPFLVPGAAPPAESFSSAGPRIPHSTFGPTQRFPETALAPTLDYILGLDNFVGDSTAPARAARTAGDAVAAGAMAGLCPRTLPPVPAASPRTALAPSVAPQMAAAPAAAAPPAEATSEPLRRLQFEEAQSAEVARILDALRQPSRLSPVPARAAAAPGPGRNFASLDGETASRRLEGQQEALWRLFTTAHRPLPEPTQEGAARTFSPSAAAAAATATAAAAPSAPAATAAEPGISESVAPPARLIIAVRRIPDRVVPLLRVPVGRLSATVAETAGPGEGASVAECESSFFPQKAAATSGWSAAPAAAVGAGGTSLGHASSSADFTLEKALPSGAACFAPRFELVELLKDEGEASGAPELSLEDVAQRLSWRFEKSAFGLNVADAFPPSVERVIVTDPDVPLERLSGDPAVVRALQASLARFLRGHGVFPVFPAAFVNARGARGAAAAERYSEDVLGPLFHHRLPPVATGFEAVPDWDGYCDLNAAFCEAIAKGVFPDDGGRPHGAENGGRGTGEPGAGRGGRDAWAAAAAAGRCSDAPKGVRFDAAAAAGGAGAEKGVTAGGAAAPGRAAPGAESGTGTSDADAAGAASAEGAAAAYGAAAHTAGGAGGAAPSNAAAASAASGAGGSGAAAFGCGTPVYRSSSDWILICNYHLLLLPRMLRQGRTRGARVAVYVGTVFPSSEIYRILPQREELLRGTVAASLIAFHGYQYKRHFLTSCTRILGVECSGDKVEPHSAVGPSGARVVTIPRGVNTEPWLRVLGSGGVCRAVAALRERFAARKIVVAVDTLEHTKGIPHKMLGFGKFLAAHPEWEGRVLYLQICIPQASSEAQDGGSAAAGGGGGGGAASARLAQATRAEILQAAYQLAGSVNACYGDIFEQPVHVLLASLSLEELAALYAVADVLLLTPLREAVSWAASEFVLCQRGRPAGERGVLVLSEFSGCAQSLGAAALRVNPWNAGSVAAAVHAALVMPPEERAERHAYALDFVTKNDARCWAAALLREFRAAVAELARERRSIPAALPLHVPFAADCYLRARHKLLIFGARGALLAPVRLASRASAARPSRAVEAAVAVLARDPSTHILIISSSSVAALHAAFSKFKSVTLVAENGHFIRPSNRLKSYNHILPAAGPPGSAAGVSQPQLAVKAPTQQAPAGATTSSAHAGNSMSGLAVPAAVAGAGGMSNAAAPASVTDAINAAQAPGWTEGAAQSPRRPLRAVDGREASAATLAWNGAPAAAFQRAEQGREVAAKETDMKPLPAAAPFAASAAPQALPPKPAAIFPPPLAAGAPPPAAPAAAPPAASGPPAPPLPSLSNWYCAASELDLDWRDSFYFSCQYFQERTPGSVLQRNATSISFNYGGAQRELGTNQARDLLINVWAAGTQALANRTDVVVGQHCVEVRSGACSKAVAVERWLQQVVQDHGLDLDRACVLCAANFLPRDEDVFVAAERVLAERGAAGAGAAGAGAGAAGGGGGGGAAGGGGAGAAVGGVGSTGNFSSVGGVPGAGAGGAAAGEGAASGVAASGFASGAGSAGAAQPQLLTCTVGLKPSRADFYVPTQKHVEQLLTSLAAQALLDSPAEMRRMTALCAASLLSPRAVQAPPARAPLSLDALPPPARTLSAAAARAPRKPPPPPQLLLGRSEYEAKVIRQSPELQRALVYLAGLDAAAGAADGAVGGGAGGGGGGAGSGAAGVPAGTEASEAVACSETSGVRSEVLDGGATAAAPWGGVSAAGSFASGETGDAGSNFAGAGAGLADSVSARGDAGIGNAASAAGAAASSAASSAAGFAAAGSAAGFAAAGSVAGFAAGSAAGCSAQQGFLALQESFHLLPPPERKGASQDSTEDRFSDMDFSDLAESQESETADDEEENSSRGDADDEPTDEPEPEDEGAAGAGSELPAPIGLAPPLPAGAGGFAAPTAPDSD